MLVLAFLALISVFIIGFFSSATGELNASSSFAASVTTKQLADTAVSLVEGNIRAATTRPAPTVLDPTKDFDAWASQPGVIRTFPGGPRADATTVSALYKLYSSDAMIVEGATAQSYNWSQDVPTGATNGWQSQTALFTDINEPVLVPDPVIAPGTVANVPLIPRYPVFDPSVFFQLGVGSTTVPLATSLPRGIMEGAALYPDTNLPNDQQYSRMPVKWLYLLKDGTVSAPSGSANGGRIATFNQNTLNPPTVDNPIVGRIAFWTDDDTCKVNINTAGGFILPGSGTTSATTNATSTTSPNSQLMYAGSFWDTPRLNTMFDRGNIDSTKETFIFAGLGGAQPQSYEYQRYPGHPATTGLGLILSQILTPTQLYNLAPRLIGGGSNGGTVLSKPDQATMLVPKVDRLYANLDELLYSMQSTSVLAAQSGQRVRQYNTNASTGSNVLTPQNLEQMRFFLTAHSRAPELNLFGRPRITLWPVYPIFASSTAKTYPHQEWPVPVPSGGSTIVNAQYDTTKFRQISTTEDKLIAFCSTIGVGLDDKNAKQYIFQRYDPYSSVNDVNIPRNAALLTILQELTSSPIPGFGGNFADKLGNTDRDEVLAEMFDYIRCINLKDTTHDDPPKFNISAETAPTNAVVRNTFKYAPHAVVVPSVIGANGSRVGSFTGNPGFGRFPLISEVALDFYHAGYLGMYMGCDEKGSDLPKLANGQIQPKFFWFFDRNLAHKAPGLTLVDPKILPSDTNPYPYRATVKNKDPFTQLIVPEAVVGKMIGAFLAMEVFNPMQGYALIDTFDANYEAGGKGSPPRREFFVHQISGLAQFKIHTASMGNNIWADLQMGDTTRGLGSNHKYWGMNAYFSSSKDSWAGRGTGGTEGFLHPLLYAGGFTPADGPVETISAQTAFNSGTSKWWYPFQSTPNMLGSPGFPPPAGSKVMDANYGLGLPKITLPAGGINPLPPHNVLPGSPPPNGVLVRNYLNPDPKINAKNAASPHPETDNGDSTFDFQGGKVTISVLWGPLVDQGTSAAINTFHLTFPNSSVPWPIPTDNIWYGGTNPGSETGYDTGGFMQPGQKLPGTTGVGDFGWNNAWETDAVSHIRQADYQFYFNRRVNWARGSSWNPWKLNSAYDGFMRSYGDGMLYNRRWRQMIQPGDTVRSMVPRNPKTNRLDGDPRVMALLGNTTLDEYFGPHPYYNTAPTSAKYNAGKVQRFAMSLRAGDGTFYVFDKSNPLNTGASIDSFALDDDAIGNPNGSGRYFTTDFGALVTGASYNIQTAAGIPPTINGVDRADGTTGGDFDTGTGPFPDGGYANKTDEGTFPWVYWDTNVLHYYYTTPYYGTQYAEDAYGTFFSPNRQVQSAVMFGSLLAGRQKHWTTLAFAPNTAGGNHPGLLRAPKDYLLLDLFTMPVVEPYPISEPFSTAGKINLNFAIEPFNHIIRTTALRAALQPLRVTALEPGLAPYYKYSGSASSVNAPTSENPRYPVDRDGTIALLSKAAYGPTGTRVMGNGSTADTMFRSATQICEQYLVPYKPAQSLPTTDPTKLTNASMSNWWRSMSLTGDNMREKPYGDLYPRLTTKSNTYTVYMRVQVLRKRPTVGNAAAALTAAQKWDDDSDQVLSEYRGSTSIERYLDPADPVLEINVNSSANSAKKKLDPDKVNLESAYHFRVVESKRFQP